VRPRFHAPLLVQTLVLVLATLAVAQVTAVFVIMNLPPAPPEVSTVEDIVQALAVPAPGETTTREGRVLEVRRTSSPPE